MDYKKLIPQLEQVKENIGHIPRNTVSADKGYPTDENTDYLEANQLDEYISPRELSRKLKNEDLIPLKKK